MYIHSTHNHKEEVYYMQNASIIAYHIGNTNVPGALYNYSTYELF